MGRTRPAFSPLPMSMAAWSAAQALPRKNSLRLSRRRLRPVEDWSERRYVPALTTIVRVFFFMSTFILFVKAIVAAALVGVVLMPRPEGAGLGVCGSPPGPMSACGGAASLTRRTTFLAILFVGSGIF